MVPGKINPSSTTQIEASGYSETSIMYPVTSQKIII